LKSHRIDKTPKTQAYFFLAGVKIPKNLLKTRLMTCQIKIILKMTNRVTGKIAATIKQLRSTTCTQ
jgi:hypothetical protein